MTASVSPPTFEALLAHRAWVRDVARRLASNAFDADDLEQDAWLAALRSPPREAGTRSWFARVLRNRRYEIHRGEVRRDARESDAARREATSSAADLVATAEAHRRVVEAVLALPEPHRGTVLLRYFEGLPPREVAARQGVPVETVRTRLKRAAELLRELLGGGERRDVWVGALAPLLRAAGGGVAMKAGTKVGAIVLALCFVTAVSMGVAIVRQDEDASSARTGEDEVVSAPGVLETGAEVQIGRAARGGVASADAAPAPPPQGPQVTGRVVSPDGSPIADAAVCVACGAWTEVGPDGRFSIDAPGHRDFAVWVIAPGLRALGKGTFPPRSADGVALGDIVLAPELLVHVRGTLRSTSGTKLESPRVKVHVDVSGQHFAEVQRTAHPNVLEMVAVSGGVYDPPEVVRRLRDMSVVPGPDGAFEIEIPASLSCFTLAASAAGHRAEYEGDLSPADCEGWRFDFALTPYPVVRGVVVDAGTGEPIIAARVTFEQRRGTADAPRTGADGRFRLDAGRDDRQLSVSADGYVGVSLETWTWPAEERTIALQRGLRISGRVLREDGSPIPQVYLNAIPLERTPGLQSPGMAVTDGEGRFLFTGVASGSYDIRSQPWGRSTVGASKEGVAAGATDVRVVVVDGVAISGTVQFEDGSPMVGAYVMAGSASDSGRAQTNAAGAFTIPGLPPGEYRLLAQAPSSDDGYGHDIVARATAGTSGHVLVLRRGLEIAGRVLDAAGRPLRHARIRACLPASNPMVDDEIGRSARTDALGAFTVTGLAPGPWRILLGHDVPPQRRWLLGGESVEAGTRDVTLRVDSGGTIGGRLVDAAGAGIPGTYIQALWNAEAGWGSSAKTDGSGQFQIRGLMRGHAYTIVSPHGRVSDVVVGTRDLKLAP